MTNRTQFSLRAAACAALLALLPFSAGDAQTVDDAFLLTTSVSPNVILFLDNSNAMNHIEWHPAFDPTAAPTCNHWNNTDVHVATSLPNSFTTCGNTRTIHKPTNETLWLGRYLNWYFSDAADPYVNEIDTATATTAGCNQAGSGTRFVDVYRRTRADAARQVFLDVLCVSEPRGLRFGLARFRDPADALGIDPNGGYISVAIDNPNPSHAANLEAHIGNTSTAGATPLSETSFQLYTYLMSRNVADIPTGVDTVTKFPAYAYDKAGNVPGNASKILGDPVQYACQKNFVVVVTTGVSSYDNFDRDPNPTSQGYDLFGSLVGDYHADGETEVPVSTDERTLYLDDIAKYMNQNDLRPDFADEQTIDYYTIGMNTSPADDAYLERVADLGDGLFFHAKDGATLSEALVATLNDIVEKSRSFTAATVPSARTSDGGDFYNSFFLPSGKTAFWEGHLRAWHFTAAGEVHDANGNCALVDPDGAGECNNGPFQVVCQPGQTQDCVVPFWDAAENVPLPGTANAAGNRALYTSLLDAAVPPKPVRTDLDLNLSAADLKVLPFVVPSDPAPNSAQYPVKGSTAIGEEGLADEVIAFARGCVFGTGASADVSTPLPCEPRTWRLGDIFHSDPIVVRNPPDRRLGSAYEGFRTAYTDRDRVIYTGTNGGFLEAIHAGTWDPVTETYDEGTGTEIFGFMPWEPRTQIKNQPIDDPTNRTHYVDGSPQISDAWIHPTATTAVQTDADWRTVLVGGLREGGRHYYALDVTNPSSDALAPAGNLPYPGLLWEFPDEDDANSGTGDYLDMGQTWGQPIITRVRLNVGANTNGGQGYERWVAIVTAGYDVISDPNPDTVDASTAYAAGSTKGRGIYVLDLKTGRVIAEELMGAAAPQNGMDYAIVSTPTVLDLNSDGYADVIYVGDLGGNIWKWVISPIGEDRVNDASNLRTQPAWKFQHFFQAPTVSSGGKTYYKNVFRPPAAAFIGNKLWIAFGTGERAAIGYKGQGGIDENNRFYAITDPDPYALAAVAPAVVGEGDLTDITAVGTPVSSARGYFFKVSEGEKFVTSTVIFAGKVITGSFTPSQLQAGDPGFDPCTQRGSGALYVFDLASGQGAYTDGAGNEARSVSVGSGMPTDPKVSIGVGGSNNKIVIQKSGSDIEIQDTDDISFGRGIIRWRELR